MVSLGLMLSLLAASREPSCNRTSLSGWLDLLNSSNQIDRERAASAIRQIGSEAVPRLVRMLRQNDSATKIKLHRLLARQSMVRIRFTWAAEQHDKAVRGFEALGPVQDAMLSLIAILNDTNASAAQPLPVVYSRRADPAAALALETLGLDVVLAALPLVTNQTSQRWLFHGIMLRPMYGDDHAVALMGRLLEECRFADIRADAANRIGTMQRWPELAVPLLTRRLILDPDPNVRVMAASALSCFGHRATNAVPALLRARSVPGLREAAIIALNVIDSNAVVDFDAGLRKEPAWPAEDLPLPPL